MTEVWGELAKSQSDAEKIEEAVTRLISAHESDPEAHLGEGDSLQSHKASEIIDHLAGSIVADKMSDKDFYFSSCFENLSLWNPTGSYTQTDFPGVRLEVDEGVVNYSSISSGLAHLGIGFFSGKSFFWQSTIRIYGGTGFVATFGPRVNISQLPAHGFYFLWQDGYLYAKYILDTGNGNASLGEVNVVLSHVYRIYYDGDKDVVYYYIDGVQKCSFNLSGLGMDNDCFIGASMKTIRAGTAKTMEIANVVFSGPSNR